MAMNNDFLEENPVHAKYITMAVKRAGMYNRLNAEDAVNFMIEDGKLSGTYEKNIECWNSLHFGPEFSAGRALFLRVFPLDGGPAGTDSRKIIAAWQGRRPLKKTCSCAALRLS